MINKSAYRNIYKGKRKAREESERNDTMKIILFRMVLFTVILRNDEI